MKNTNKKRGFTIVELVIVIAVIAILAAVMIPTFVGLVDKANVSADEQAVKQMNTILAADGAVVATTPEELFNVLSEAGFEAKSYSPLSKGKYFFWDSGINRILYVDSDYTILNTQDANGANEDNWFSLDGKIEMADAAVVLSEVKADGSVEIADGKELAALLTVIADKNVDTTSVKTIVLPASVNVMGADVMIEKLTQPLTFKGAEGGSVIKGVVVNRAARVGVKNMAKTEREYNCGLIGATTKSVTFENITLENCVIGDESASLSAAFVGAVNGGTVEFKNCKLNNVTVRGLQKVGSFVGVVQGTKKATTVVKFDDKCDATGVTVEATAGLAGGIFGYWNNYADIQVAKVANFDDVTVKLNKVTTGYYITDKDGKVYGIDLESDLVPAGTYWIDVNKNKVKDDGEDTGLYRYFTTTTQYGWKNGNMPANKIDLSNASLRPAGDFNTALYKDGAQVIIAYGATEWTPAPAVTE